MSRGRKQAGLGRLRAAAAFAAALAASPAVASPFCVSVQGIPDQCIYADGASCGRYAVRAGGICTVNSAEISTPSGPGLFCLAESGHAVACVYPDRNTCQVDADRRHTACVPVSTPPAGSVDPFAQRRPY